MSDKSSKNGAEALKTRQVGGPATKPKLRTQVETASGDDQQETTTASGIFKRQLRPLTVYKEMESAKQTRSKRQAQQTLPAVASSSESETEVAPLISLEEKSETREQEGSKSVQQDVKAILTSMAKQTQSMAKQTQSMAKQTQNIQELKDAVFSLSNTVMTLKNDFIGVREDINNIFSTMDRFTKQQEKNARFRIVEDYSPEVMKERMAFKSVMSEIYQIGLKQALLFPAKLRVTFEDNSHRIFKTPADVKKFLEERCHSTIS